MTGSVKPVPYLLLVEEGYRKLENSTDSDQFENMSDTEVRRLEDRIDAVNREGQLRLESMVARTDTKFAEMLGEMRTGFASINGRLDHLEKTGVDVKATISNVKTTVIGTGIGVLALTLAALSYGQAWFGIGVSTRDVVKSAVTEYVLQHPNLLPAPPVK